MRIAAVIASWVLLCMLSAGQARADRDVPPVDPTQAYRLSQDGSKIMAAMLEQMGLKLPPERKVIDPPGPKPAPRPAPRPRPRPAPPQPEPAPPQPEPAPPEPDPVPPEPAPEPRPEPAPPQPAPSGGDDFFEDDFFGEDKSFEEIVEEMDENFEATVAAWDKDYEETVARWNKAREVYLEREDEYQATAIPLEGAAASLQAGGTMRVDLRTMRPGDFYVIPGALDLAARDQARRGTCTAFAGVRALETLLVQRGVRTDLSEEHFYFLSKPECRSTPCGSEKEGGSVDGGLKATRDQRASGLMTEAVCPYTPNGNAANITNAPLATCSGPGLVRAGNLGPVRNTADLLNALRSNQPIVIGFTLTRSYSRNLGLVRLNDPVNKERASGRDAGGHANLLVGFIKLPPSMSSEGQFCAITANSWAEGWGRGGHACLTEAWIKDNFLSAATVQSVRITNSGVAQFGL